MFRVLDLEADHHVHAPRDLAAAIAMPPAGVTRWIDLVEPDPASLAKLQEAFALHPLAIADCAAYGQQSRVDDYEDYLFIVAHVFTKDPKDPLEIQIHEIHAFVGPNWLITVHDNPVPAHEETWRKAATDPAVLQRGPSWALYLSLATMIDDSEPVVDALIDELDDVERAVIERSADTELGVVFRIKRHAVAMRRVLRPLRDSLKKVQDLESPLIHKRAELYLRGLHDQVVRLTELVEEARDVANGIVGGYHAVQATKANEVMKRLTIFSIVFLPLGVIVGFWGQNFTQLPYDQTWALVLMLSSLVIVPLGLMEWIRRKWL